MKLIKICAVALVVLLSGCATNVYPGGPTLSGALMSNTTSTAAALAVPTHKDAQPAKVGEASTTAVFGLLSFGDSSVTEAMKNANITKVHHVDYRNTTVLLGLFAQTTTIVYGE
ncbi:TRL family protein [Bacterioplanes sanyensis]|uniref:TRL domain-containing protein n=1 Tax=Bacterioplanes sanyensis TaxID=1249553 RepID=UPI001673FEF7|nr:TRL domain-containing protein [Bacterioplanes sanyensis]GGY44556.1 TRL family protein [Bacterioplanes sanyensis]